jgi:hypothetical protein
MQRPTLHPDQSGALAQLVERYLCKVDVRSSILLGSTTKNPISSGISLHELGRRIGAIAHILPTIAS